MGQPNLKREYYISDTLDLKSLQQRSRSDGAKIDDIFGAACLSAYSNLDLPQDLKPSQFNAIYPINSWPPEFELETFQPKNDNYGAQIALKPAKDMTEALQSIRLAMKVYDDKPYLPHLGNIFTYGCSLILPIST